MRSQPECFLLTFPWSPSVSDIISGIGSVYILANNDLLGGNVLKSSY